MGCPLKGGGGLYSRVRLGAVLLAAGEGRRMNGIAKAAIQMQGVPLINRALFGLSGAGVDEVVVVLGHQADLLEPMVKDFPVTIVRNSNYTSGQMSSVQLGLENLTGTFDAVLICLADQPLLNTQDLTALIGAFKKRSTGSIVMPRVHGQRGNPIIFDWNVRNEILAGQKNLGCRNYIEKNPELVSPFETDNDHYVVDLDTPEDVDKLQKRLGLILNMPEALHPVTSL
ncbi:nicotine blue oxidoreductase [mine drainage metagenome]|uniref:Nicotine blue oxidoreductase n=1 Tax=mine drainage metagenome TaxID=410659 RepID=A0A1J5RS50_9ZZZZ